MERPYIICHMVTSIDGKVTGDFLSGSNSEKAIELYYDINRKLKSNGFICGRVTMESSFTGGWYPDLSEFDPYEALDYIPKDLSEFYAVAFDTNGKLGWKKNVIIDPDEDPGYDGAQIVEVLSENVDMRYLGYLRSLNIPYIFAGKDKIDVNIALDKLKKHFNADRLLLEGGSIINGAFLDANAVDELSIVVAPIIADKDDKPLFMNSNTSDFELINSAEKSNVIFMNYKRKKEN